MLFDDSIQVVLQRPRSGAGFACECFACVPSPWPSLIAVVPIGGAQAEADADRAATAIARFLKSTTGTSGIVPAPCAPSSKGPVGCLAHRERDCRRVLVLIGDGSRRFNNDPYGAIKYWASRVRTASDRFVVIPCLPEKSKPKAKALLSGPLAGINVHFWVSDAADIAPAVLPAAGITVEDYRVFVSYRREDGQVLADQLFDELNRRNFDVFLDQYRINAGVNFQERLREELAHKSMVVVLETPKITVSKWVEQEVVFAVINRLGLLAIQVPNGATMQMISGHSRMTVPQRAFVPDGKLGPQWLDKVCRRISLVHSFAMLRRRHQMRQAMRLALLREGVVQQRMVSSGFLEAYPASRVGGNPYSVWLTPRPADLADFHYIDLEVGKVQNPRPILIAPSASMIGRRSADMRWLGKTANTHFFDEADLAKVARDIGRGVL
jgi:hypothetical protein